MLFGKCSHKADVDVRKHEDQSLCDADLTVHEDDNGYVRAWRAGLTRAEATAQTLGISVPTDRHRVWESERTDINQMRDAGADEDAELTAAAAEQELTTESASAAAPAAASPPSPADAESENEDEPLPSAPILSELPLAPASPEDEHAELAGVSEGMGDVLVRLVDDFASDAATAAPAATQPRDQPVLLPSGALALKASLIAELHPGEKLSKDRLKRVATKQLPALA
jgi:hypothetical protein